MEERTWHDLYRDLKPPVLGRTITGFNVNIDRTIPVTRELLDSLPEVSVVPEGFRERLYRSMQTCTADELFVPDTTIYRQFSTRFPGDSALGGQAGIAAGYLAAAGVPEVICIAPSLGTAAAGMLRNAGVTVPGSESMERRPDAVHLVFEHKPGLVPLDTGTVPRNNRFIVSPRHMPSVTLLSEAYFREFRIAASFCNRAFLSGYQYLSSDQEFQIAAEQLRVVKSLNPELRIHVEWVTVSDPAITMRFLRTILPQIDSLGANERETRLLYNGLTPPAAGKQDDRDVITRIRQAQAICRSTGLRRMHLHTYGYYITICNEPSRPEVSRDALLLASRAAAENIGVMAPGFIPEGHRALDDMTEEFGRDTSPGIFHTGEYTAIVVPTLMATGISQTAGLGDKISSLAFVADPF